LAQTVIEPPPPTERATDISTEFWHTADLVAAYADTRLRPVEALLLERYHESLSGRVLEIGVGAGRLTQALGRVASSVYGLDVSPDMVERARRSTPGATIDVRDMRDLSAYPSASFDGVVAGFNVIDAVGHDDRLSILSQVRRILVPGGVLVFSSHNRAFIPSVHRPARQVLADLADGRFRRAAKGIARLPARIANHRRLRPHERSEPAYAIVNDTAHDYSILHYYIARDDQERQLAALGFDLLECRDLAADLVPAGRAAATSSELHYVARRTGGA
jgi:SAM-dependent methyltransferase